MPDPDVARSQPGVGTWGSGPSRTLVPRLTIIYDHYRGTLQPEKLPLLEHGQVVEFKVENVNIFLYTVRVAVRTLDEFATVPPAFASMAKGPEAPPAPPSPPGGPSVPSFEPLVPERPQPPPSYEDVLPRVRRALVIAEEATRTPEAIDEIVFSDATEPRGMAEIVGKAIRRLLPTEGSDVSLPLAWEKLKLNARESLTQLEPLATTSTQKAELRELRNRYDTLDKNRDTMNQRLRETDALVSRVRDASFDGPTATTQASGDILVIDLESQLLPGRAGKRVFNTSGYLSLEIAGGVVVNFSTGLMFSSLRDRSYVADAEGKIRRRGSEDRFSVVPAAIAHLVRRTASPIRWAPISFGIGLGSDRIHYFLGTSALGADVAALSFPRG